jgi:formyl-CoA transferase
LADTIGGITAAMGITASLSNPEREAVFIDVSMLEATMASMGWVISNYLMAGVDPMRMGNENFTSAPSGTFQTGQGLLNIAANKQEQFEILCNLLNREDLLHHPDFKTRELRKTNRELLKSELEAELKNNDAKIWSELLNEAGVPAGEVLAVPEALNLDQVQQRGFLETFSDVPGIGRSLQVVKTGMQLNGKTLTVDRPPPRLGEDTVTILKDCGYGEDAIEKLQAEKVI